MSISEQLSRLQITQESIVNTSELMINHYKKNPNCASYLIEEWNTFFIKQTNNQGKLKMLYLSNDLLQKLHQQGDTHFIELIKDNLQAAFQICFKESDETFREQITKILQIWNARNIYPKHILKEFRLDVQKQNQIDQIQKIEDLIPVSKELVFMVEAQKDLNKWIQKFTQIQNNLKKSSNPQGQLLNKEIQQMNEELKKSLEFQQKFRQILLTHYAEIMTHIDKENLKCVLELKKVQNKIDTLAHL